MALVAVSFREEIASLQCDCANWKPLSAHKTIIGKPSVQPDHWRAASFNHRLWEESASFPLP